jgi:hypothetical protein
MRLLRLMVLASLGASASASAQSANLFTCRATSGFAWGCVLDQRVLSEPLTFEGAQYHSEYRVVYDFPCTGHVLSLGFSGEQGLVPLQQGGRNTSAVVGSSGPLRLRDPDPARTAGLTFQGDCRLQVRSVDVRPSTSTQDLWFSEARSQAQIIQLLSRMLLLARDVHNVSSWNDDKLVLMRDRLRQLTSSDPRNLQYRVLLETVESALVNAPPSFSEAEIDAAGQEVAVAVRAELGLAVQEGNRMVRRFQAWRLAVEATLQAALRDILG